MASGNAINNIIGNFEFDETQAVGAGQDNNVLTYDDGTGLISLEARGGAADALLVAASNAPADVIARADYVCDGTADDVQIQAALDASASVVLSTGTFAISASIIMDTNNSLRGQGEDTVLLLDNTVDDHVIATSSAANVFFCYIGHLQINGNKANNTAGYGIYAHNAHTWLMEHLHIQDCAEQSIRFAGDSGAVLSINNTVINSRLEDSGNINVFIFGFAPNNQIKFNIIGGTDANACLDIRNTEAIVVGNHIHSATAEGVVLSSTGDEGVFVGNICEVNGTDGLRIASDATQWTITGNKFRNNGQTAAGSGIRVQGTRNVVTGNMFVDTQGTPTQDYGIEIEAGADNNRFAGNNYDLNQTGTILQGGANNEVLDFAESETATVAAGDTFMFTDVDDSNNTKADTVQGILDLVPSTSQTNEGLVELATAAEIDTGTDTTRAMPVDQYVASKRNIHFLEIRLVAPATAVTTGTDIYGDWRCPFAGTIIQDDSNPEWFSAWTDDAGTTGTMVVDVNLNGSTIMTTNKLDIETTEKSSATAATQPDLTTTAIAAGDILTFDIDAIHTGTAANGLVVRIPIRMT